MVRCSQEPLAVRFSAAVLDEQERQLYETHLETCDNCRQAVRDAWQMADLLIYAHRGSSTPRHLLSRIERRAHIRGRGKYPWPTRAILVAGAVGVAMSLWLASVLPSAARHDLSKWAHLATLAHAKPVTSSNGMTVATLISAVSGSGAKGQAMERGDVLMLSIDALPPAPAGQVYEVWGIGPEGPVALGAIAPSSGSVAKVYKLTGTAGFTKLYICHEPQSVAGRWMGPVALAGTFEAP